MGARATRFSGMLAMAAIIALALAFGIFALFNLIEFGRLD